MAIALPLVIRGATLIAALGFVVHCAHAAAPPLTSGQAPAALVTDANVSALRRDHPGVEVQLDGRGEQVRRLTGLHLTGPAGVAPEAVALAGLRDSSLSRALGLSPDLRELCHPVSRPDPGLVGHAVVRIQQCAGPLRVIGAELVMSVRVGESAGIESVTSSLAATLPANITPRISAADARQAAAAALANLKPAEDTEVNGELKTPELIVFDPRPFGLKGSTRLAWLVSNGQIATVIDALTGGNVHQYAETIRNQ